MRNLRPGAKAEEQDLYREMLAFDALTSAVIDSSSAICMADAGFFDAVAKAVRLYTVPEVLEETGFPWMANLAHAEPVPAASADDAVLALAKNKTIPLISEDRKLLLKTAKHGIVFYNSIMMLHMLLYRGAVSDSEHRCFQQKLLKRTRYSDAVLSYAGEVHQAVMKYRP